MHRSRDVSPDTFRLRAFGRTSALGRPCANSHWRAKESLPLLPDGAAEALRTKRPPPPPPPPPPPLSSWSLMLLFYESVDYAREILSSASSGIDIDIPLNSLGSVHCTCATTITVQLEMCFEPTLTSALHRFRWDAMQRTLTCLKSGPN